MRQDNECEVVIVGGGPAGLSAALWLARYRHTVRLFDAGDPRNAATWAVHGYPGIQDPTPTELRATLRAQAVDAGAGCEPGCVVAIAGEDGAFRVRLDDDRTIGARKVLLATGLRDIIPEIPGLPAFYGGSIWHCSDCDGPSVPDRRVGVIGWGRTIAGFCMGMLTWTDRLTVLSHGRDAELDERSRAALERWEIPVETRAIARLEGDEAAQRVERVVFEDGDSLEVDAIFFHIASGPGSNLAAELGCAADGEGILAVDADLLTSIPGVHAAGDVTPGARLAIRASYEGVRAAIALHRSLIPDDRRIG
jgi:thioredoxin reductase